MEYLSRSRLPVFTPRLDLTAEDLNAQAEVICTAINELAGRLHIIKDLVVEIDRSQFAEETSFPILDEFDKLWDDIRDVWDTVTSNKEDCDTKYTNAIERITELDSRLNALITQQVQILSDRIQDLDTRAFNAFSALERQYTGDFSTLERRFNTLDDAAARRSELATIFDRIQYVQENSTPNIGKDGYWYIGKIKTTTLAQGPQGDQGIQGIQGPIGDTGAGIQYNWRGKELGVKTETEATYEYTNLEGPTYTITEADYRAIAEIVKDSYVDGNGVEY